MNEREAGTNWWRPERAVGPTDAVATGSRMAFGALVAFTAILLLTPQTWIPALKTMRIALVAAGLAILLHVLDSVMRRRTVFPAGPEVLTAVALLSWSVMTIPFSIWPGGSVSLLTDQYLKAVVFFWLIATLVTTRARLRTFGWALVLCAIPLALIALQHFQSGVYVTSGRAPVQRIAGLGGITGNPNDLALTLNLLIPIAGALLFTTRGVVARTLAAGAVMLSIPAVIVTFSRAGFLTLGTIAIVSLIFFARRRAAAPAVAVLTVALCAAPLLPSGYLQRLDTITDIDADPTGSAQGRWSDYQMATQVISQNPFIGVGMGQDILALDKLRDRPTWRSVHNAYLEYAVDLGLPGILMFLALLVAAFSTARNIELRSARDPALRDLTILASGVQIALIAFAVGACFHPIAYQFYFFCVAGLAVAMKNVYRAERASVPVQAS